uniref:Uncharacterized protein n=1 Tax=Tetradesmus obliquus TaxID=3088 RepID=A0A383W7T6_TETOB|eukprot:jgi/Sobl393_1/11646/SZX73501.1
MSRTQANQHSLEALSSSLRQLLNNATTLSYLRQWTSSAAALGALVKDSRSLRPLIVSSDLFELLCNSLSLYLRLLVAASTATTAAASTAAPLDAVELEVLLLLACAVLECRTLFGSQDSDRLLEVVDSSGILAAVAAACPAVTALCATGNTQQQADSRISQQGRSQQQQQQRSQIRNKLNLAGAVVELLRVFALLSKHRTSDLQQWQAVLLPAAEVGAAALQALPGPSDTASSISTTATSSGCSSSCGGGGRRNAAASAAAHWAPAPSE